MIILFKFRIWLNKACEVGENVLFMSQLVLQGSLREKSEGLVVLNFRKSVLKIAVIRVVFWKYVFYPPCVLELKETSKLV